MFFVEALGVLPPRFRPANLLGGKLNFHAQNKNLDAILVANNRIVQVGKEKDGRTTNAKDVCFLFSHVNTKFIAACY